MSKIKIELGLDSINHWRQFGDDGRGVALIIYFPQKNHSVWDDGFGLSSVFYNESDLCALKEFEAKHNEFVLKNKYINRNYWYDILRPLLCFHKSKIYKAEEEIRLMKYFPRETLNYFESQYKHFEAIKTEGNLQYFKLNLNWIQEINKIQNVRNGLKHDSGSWKYLDKSIKESYPKLIIKKVLLGYRFKQSELKDISGSIEQESLRHLKYKIPVEITPLSKEFNLEI